MLRLLSIVSSISCTDEKFFAVHDELCMNATVDRLADEDLENSKLSVLLTLEDNCDIHLSAED